MIGADFKEKVAQGVYNYMKQFLNLSTFIPTVANKLVEESIVNLNLIASLQEKAELATMVQTKFSTNAPVVAIAQMIAGGGAAATAPRVGTTGARMAPPVIPKPVPEAVKLYTDAKNMLPGITNILSTVESQLTAFKTAFRMGDYVSAIQALDSTIEKAEREADQWHNVEDDAEPVLALKYLIEGVNTQVNELLEGLATARNSIPAITSEIDKAIKAESK